MYPPHEVVLDVEETTYPPGIYPFPPIAIGKGYQSLVMKASKVGWPKVDTNIFAGHLDVSDDGGKTWRHMATWTDNGCDVHDDDTGKVLPYTFMRLELSARSDKPVYTHEMTWVRARLDCALPLTTALTIERA